MARFLLKQNGMKAHASEIGHRIPRMIAERKPIRPVRIAAIRPPIKVTKPISFGPVTLAPVRSR